MRLGRVVFHADGWGPVFPGQLTRTLGLQRDNGLLSTGCFFTLRVGVLKLQDMYKEKRPASNEQQRTVHSLVYAEFL